jgi:hypothetical protein
MLIIIILNAVQLSVMAPEGTMGALFGEKQWQKTLKEFQNFFSVPFKQGGLL